MAVFCCNNHTTALQRRRQLHTAWIGTELLTGAEHDGTLDRDPSKLALFSEQWLHTTRYSWIMSNTLPVLKSYPTAKRKEEKVHKPSDLTSQHVSGQPRYTDQQLGNRWKWVLTAQSLQRCPTCWCCHHHPSRWSCWIPARYSSW